MNACENLIDALRRTAQDYPSRGIHLFDLRGRNAERRTYAEMIDSVLACAARLAQAGVRPGQTVMISLGTSWELLELWLGCVACGALPVNLASGSGPTHWAKVDGLLAKLECAHFFGSDALARIATEEGRPDLGGRVRTHGQIAALAPAAGFAPHAAGAGDSAFLQLTSGSTGLPRAVVIPHSAALHNPAASVDAIGAPFGAPATEWAESMVSWLPLHHDMGLVGCLLMCLSYGFDLWLLSPKTFLARPEVWLRELGRHGPTFAPAPNFAYQTCIDRVDPSKLHCDLSQWRSALCGAEMIRQETIENFCRAFEARGFKREAVRACYGLAEGTLAVTFDMRGAGLRSHAVPEGSTSDTNTSESVCVGAPIRDTELKIIAPNGSVLGENAVGEVCAKGPSIYAGYYNDPEETAQGLRNGWLHTGDLGFVVDGELYITGRTKDLIIVRGHNVMPHELEWCAEQVTGGGGAARAGAFSVHDPREGEVPVLVAELNDPDPGKLDALAHDVRVLVGRDLGLTLADVVFVRRGKIPKTTSGKVQRRQLRSQYIDGALERLGPTVAGSARSDS